LLMNYDIPGCGSLKGFEKCSFPLQILSAI
jgi:hypothetical protein